MDPRLILMVEPEVGVISQYNGKTTTSKDDLLFLLQSALKLCLSNLALCHISTAVSLAEVVFWGEGYTSHSLFL